MSVPLHAHQTLTITALGAEDKWHAQVAGTAVSATCRYTVRQHQVRLPTGEIVIAEAEATVGPAVTVAVGNQVALGGDSRQYRVIAIDEIRGLSGTVLRKRLQLQ